MAAITLPSLVNNYKKQQYVNQLKKAYSEIQYAFKLMLAEDEVDNLEDTVFFRNFPAETSNMPGVEDYLDTALPKYFKIFKTCHKNNENCNTIQYYTMHNTPLSSVIINGSTTYNFYTTDGKIIYFSEFRKQMLPDENTVNFRLMNCPDILGRIAIDINGEKNLTKMAEICLCIAYVQTESYMHQDLKMLQCLEAHSTTGGRQIIPFVIRYLAMVRAVPDELLKKVGK